MILDWLSFDEGRSKLREGNYHEAFYLGSKEFMASEGNTNLLKLARESQTDFIESAVSSIMATTASMMSEQAKTKTLCHFQEFSGFKNGYHYDVCHRMGHLLTL